MSDYIVRATAADAQIRAFAATTKELVEYARTAHNTSPIMTAALGRLLTAGSMMGCMLKGDKDILTLQISGDGPAKGLLVTADSKANVKGYVTNPDVLLPPNTLGKLDVGGAIGKGFLNVIKDMGLKDPYVGQIQLQTGEIADDLTYYFATSEQVPSTVGLGVLMNKDNTVAQAGGFIIQLMPFAEEAIVAALEEKLQTIKGVTGLLSEGKNPEQILDILLGDMNLEIQEKIPTSFKCNCSKKRVEKVLLSVGQDELRSMIEDGKEVTLNCHFCNTNYAFTVDELKKLLRTSRK